MKTTKGGKVMNPTDAYRKELRKKELKRNKKERKKVREVGILKKDPDTIKQQIEKLEKMKADGALDKARKHKKRQLEDTLNLVMKKRKEYEDKMKEKGEVPVMFSHLGPPSRRPIAKEDQPNPEDSVYYHPTLNPTGAPPPGKPPMYKPSIASSSNVGASSSISDPDEAGLSAPPPPPPPPLPMSDEPSSSSLPSSLPLPPPPPPPKPPMDAKAPAMPPPPPPPPAPPARDQVAGFVVPPPPPPPQRPPQAGDDKSGFSEDATLKEAGMASLGLPPPPPPPPGFVSELNGSEPQANLSASKPTPTAAPTTTNEPAKSSKLVLPPPPPLPPHMMPPGVVRLPPPPPPSSDMRQLGPPQMIPGPPGQPSLPPPPPPPQLLGMIPPAQVMQQPYPLPPGPPPMMMPGLPGVAPGPPMMQQKPSYVKSAAPTVVKRPLAQHTPELTAMVPASVRVRRESALPKGKPKAQVSASAWRPSPATTSKLESTATSAGQKSQSVDDSYMAFLEEMKELGALDS
ncbi:hypothetical protein LUZ63_000909 [Rhynchospora breviuscula]|uniref:Wbp11/ELF5/Saf1 N-terminal domain-containing protein n=1 Tax=Rhynchospora breviuscula TaxID=2022672 RepID=A0A9Q0HX33_9POAL|nr:hypothetical protein LUZ63_000909 [Rhynchospora breviuscula]